MPDGKECTAMLYQMRTSLEEEVFGPSTDPHRTETLPLIFAVGKTALSWFR